VSNNSITVWNASSSVLKIGEKKSLLKPAESARVEQDAAISELINAGKLVVVTTNETNVGESSGLVEQAPRKKTKKDTTSVESKEEAEASVLVETEDNPPVETNEVLEDSILPEETV
jgi:hypothetical protein